MASRPMCGEVHANVPRSASLVIPHPEVRGDSRASKDALAVVQAVQRVRTAFLALALTLLAATPAAACQCFNFSRAEIVQRADIVFEGTVAVVTLARGQLQATIDVTRLENGPDVTSLTLLTPASSAACGIPLQVTQRVVIAARRDGPFWRTDLCMALGLRPAPLVPNR